MGNFLSKCSVVDFYAGDSRSHTFRFNRICTIFIYINIPRQAKTQSKIGFEQNEWKLKKKNPLVPNIYDRNVCF